MSEPQYSDFYPDRPPRRFAPEPAEADTSGCPDCSTAETVCDSLPAPERCCQACRDGAGEQLSALSSGSRNSRSTYDKVFPNP